MNPAPSSSEVLLTKEDAKSSIAFATEDDQLVIHLERIVMLLILLEPQRGSIIPAHGLRGTSYPGSHCTKKHLPSPHLRGEGRERGIQASQISNPIFAIVP